MKLTISEIATLVNGQVIGNQATVIEGVAGITEAHPNEITFAKNLKNPDTIKKCQAGAILVGEKPSFNGKNFIVVKNPLEAFTLILHKVQEEKALGKKGVHSTAIISSSATLGKEVYIGPYCVIEDGARIEDFAQLDSQVYVGPRSKVGAHTKIFPQVVLREDIEIGAHCIIHPGTVIGSDGFGYFFSNGKHQKIPQVGKVIIEDNVEIGAGTAIDRATTGTTRIGRGTKIDNLVHLAHNVTIGENSILAAQVGIAGSSHLEEGVVLAGQVGVADHVRIGKGTQIGAQSGIKNDIKPGSVFFGSPAQPLQETLKQILLIRRLPQLFSEVKKIKEKVFNK